MMKGVIFCEFIDMIETRFSLELADRIIASCQLATGGAYTAVGDYDHREMLALVDGLSEATATPAARLLRDFGEHLLRRFAELYPACFAGQRSTFGLLRSFNGPVQRELFRRSPGARMPTLQHEIPDRSRMVVWYSSHRPFADLAEGMLRGCIDHFGECIDLAREDLPCERGVRARFLLTAAEENQ